MQTKPSAMQTLAKANFFAKKKKSPIEGYVERLEQNEIHGWVINREHTEINIVLRIDNVSYQAPYSWHERADVSASVGSEFILPGFTITIPDSLLDTYTSALQNDKSIEVIANNKALVNRNKTVPSSEFITKKSKSNKTLEGHVEQIFGLEIRGWIVNQDKDETQLALSINNKAYPVTAIWHERPDVAAKFGSDFKNSGFSIIIPDEIVDIFLAACQYDLEAKEEETGETGLLLKAKKPDRPSSIDIIANETRLLNKRLQTNATLKLLPASFKFSQMLAQNAEIGIYINSKDFQQILSGQASSPLTLSRNHAINANFYLELAKQKLIAHNIDVARTLLKICLTFEQRAEFLELLGNTYLEQRDYETAAAHYEAAVLANGRVSKWLFSNLEQARKQATNPKTVINSIIAGIERNPEFNFLYDRLDDLIQSYWSKQQGRLEVMAITDDRAGLLAAMTDISGFIYQTYLQAFGAKENPTHINQCNLQRILIIGDMHIPQCVRYRIDQKVEQLEFSGKEVTTISWLDIAKYQKELVFHDVIIFYRVPAEPQVLKTMAQVNATGKLSLYEIDDLLFDAAYPPPIETYGGYLSLNLYIQILKGMASFNAAARYCRFGLASTRPLADKLAPLVFANQCYIHRNGIDSNNLFRDKMPNPAKPTIDIFYGSGTMAHNSDFNELALPAITRILDEFPQAALMIAGYLKLPSEFIKRYPGRIKQMPPVKNIKTYWALLERADINLAVLHDDDINSCKSELKWFEAACLGIPSVLSTTANYRDVIQQDQDGILVSSSEDWYQGLKSLIENPEKRQNMAQQALARVHAEYSVEALATNINNVLSQAVSSAQVAERPARKKIALVNVFFPPQSIGGGTRVVSDNFDLLQKHYSEEFELCVFTSDAEHKTPHIPHVMTIYNHQGARVYRATVVWREHMDWNPYDEEMKTLFEDFLIAEQPDLIHFHCVQRLGGGVLEAAREAKIPYIVTTHDAWWISDYQFLVDENNKVYPDGHPNPYEEYTPPSFTTLSESMERILYLKDLLNHADEVLTVSDTFADIYRKNDVPRVNINKNGISASIDWQPKDTHYTNNVVIGHVGGMAEHKGYFLLKKAITKLQPKNIEVLVVDSSQDEGYRMESHWGKVPVTFVGRYSQIRVAELYSQIDVLFAPSTWPESYGLVTREAAACQCWVVASNMGGIAEDVIDGKTGFIINPTLDAITSCLTTINKNPEQFKENVITPSLRCVTEQVKELADIYRQRTQHHE